MAGVTPSNVPIITPFGEANPNLSPISSGAWASGNITDGRAISNTVNDPFNVLSAFAQGSQLGGVPLWSSAIPYATGAVVSRLAGGSIKWFTALTPVTAGNLPPETNPTLWTIFTSGSTSLFNSNGSQFDWTAITTSTSVLVINGTAGNAMSLPPTGLLNDGTSIRLENISSSNYRFNITGTQTIIGNYNAGSTSTFFVLPAGANVLLIISGNTMAFYSFGIGVGSNFIGQAPQLIGSAAVPGMAALPAISGEFLTNLPIPPPTVGSPPPRLMLFQSASADFIIPSGYTKLYVKLIGPSGGGGGGGAGAPGGLGGSISSATIFIGGNQLLATTVFNSGQSGGGSGSVGGGGGAGASSSAYGLAGNDNVSSTIGGAGGLSRGGGGAGGGGGGTNASPGTFSSGAGGLSYYTGGNGGGGGFNGLGNTNGGNGQTGMTHSGYNIGGVGGGTVSIPGGGGGGGAGESYPLIAYQSVTSGQYISYDMGIGNNGQDGFGANGGKGGQGLNSFAEIWVLP